jgi:penicillin-binding protein 1A
MADEPFMDLDEDGVMEWPVNYYTEYRYGYNMTIEKAIQVSCNTIAAKVCEQVGFSVVFDHLTNRFGFSKITSSTVIGGKVFTDNAISPMSLGSLTEGVSVLEMAAAYSIFGNGGIYYEPHTYTVVYDASGNVLLEKDGNPKRVISQGTAAVMNKLLQSVATGGTGTPARFSNDIEIAAKTGTTSDNKDLYCAGLTPEYVTAVWMGFDEQKTISYNSPYPPPALIGTVFKEIYKNKTNPQKTFNLGNSIVQHNYCKDSGQLAAYGCTNVGVGYYSTDKMPQECYLHGGGYWYPSGGGGNGNAADPNNPIFWGGGYTID